MSEQQLNVNNETLTSIKEKLFSGKAAFESDELEKLYKQFEYGLTNAIQSKEVCKNEETSKEWLDIVGSISTGDFADSLFTLLNEQLFYNFGNHFVEEKAKHPENHSIDLLIHAYLNLLRTTSLLKKIYKEKKWEKLVLELISASNYNVNVLFNQRVAQYKGNTLFKILKGKNIREVSWQDTNNDVIKYARAFYSLIKNYEVEKVKISFLLENDPHMPLLDLACLTTGIVNVMIPANSVMEHIEFILNQTESPLIIVHDEKQLLKVKSIKNNL